MTEKKRCSYRYGKNCKAIINAIDNTGMPDTTASYVDTLMNNHRVVLLQ